LYGAKQSLLRRWLTLAIVQSGEGYEAFPRLNCDFGYRCFTPDVLILASHRVPVDATGAISDGALKFAPDWVIEIASQQQSQPSAIGNILHCMKHGCRLGWLIDPKERSVLVYQPGRLPDLLAGNEALPILPEVKLTLTVEQLFDSLRLKS
jgi:Uma2 family endonuclease